MDGVCVAGPARCAILQKEPSALLIARPPTGPVRCACSIFPLRPVSKSYMSRENTDRLGCFKKKIR